MNGAECLFRTLVANGLDVCFTNPGTTEIHCVAALDAAPEMRAVLCLFEGVATGAADGYARMTGRPACTLLHLGPGLANGLANLHNARRARVPLLNIIGDHATYHRPFDAPLTSDIVGFAAPVSAWIRTSSSSQTLAGDALAACAAANTRPGRVATLIVPADVAWGEAQAPAAQAPSPPSVAAPVEHLDEVLAALRSGEPCAILLGGSALSEPGVRLAARISRATSADLLRDYFVTRVARGAGRMEVARVPYLVDQALAALRRYRHLILIAAQPPVAFFAYPGQPSALTPPDCAIHTLATPERDGLAALEQLADALAAGGRDSPAMPLAPPGAPQGALSLITVAQAIGHRMPEHAIVVNEAVSSGFAIPDFTARAAPHDWLDVTGGSVGGGLPLALGAAIANPDRRVIALEGDGSGMYTSQALWSMAREGANVTTVVFANRGYAILQLELLRASRGSAGKRSAQALELSRPDIDWVALARAQGVPGERASNAQELDAALSRSLATPGPSLIEAVLPAGLQSLREGQNFEIARRSRGP
jgi:acetolactate synthase-1/2/3 large subunit